MHHIKFKVNNEDLRFINQIDPAWNYLNNLSPTYSSLLQIHVFALKRKASVSITFLQI